MDRWDYLLDSISFPLYLLHSRPFIFEKYTKQRKGKENIRLKFTLLLLEISQINLPDSCDSPNLQYQITRCLWNPFKTYPDNRKILDSRFETDPETGDGIRSRSRNKGRKVREDESSGGGNLLTGPLKVTIIWLSDEEQSTAALRSATIYPRAALMNHERSGIGGWPVPMI